MPKSDVETGIKTSKPDSAEYIGILPCEGRDGGFYPNVDISIWLRKVFYIHLVPFISSRTFRTCQEENKEEEPVFLEKI